MKLFVVLLLLIVSVSSSADVVGEFNHKVLKVVFEPNVTVNSVSAFGTNGLIAGTAKGVYVKPEGQTNWLLLGLENIPVYSTVATKSGVVFCATNAYGLFAFDSKSQLWSTVKERSESAADMFLPYSLLVDNDGVVYTSAYGKGVSRSLDNGATWNAINAGLVEKDVTSMCLFNYTQVVVGTESHGLLMFDEQTSSWEPLSAKLSAGFPAVYSLTALRNGTILAGTSTDVVMVDVVNNDFSKQTLITPLAHEYNAAVNSLSGDGNSTVYAATSHGIFLSTNAGVSWYSVRGVDEEPKGIQTIAVHSDKVYFSSESGFFALDITPWVGVESKSEGALMNPLHNNPIGGQGVVRYHVQNPSTVEVALYSMDGDKIATLDKSLKDAGAYELVWNAEHLAPGTYFCTVKNGNVESIMKLIKE